MLTPGQCQFGSVAKMANSESVGAARGANMAQSARAPKSKNSKKTVKSENRAAPKSTKVGRTGLEPVTSAV